MENEVHLAIGQRLRDLRIEKGISLRQFASDHDFHPNVLSRIERGEHNITIGTLFRLGRALDISPAEVLRGLK